MMNVLHSEVQLNRKIHECLASSWCFIHFQLWSFWIPSELNIVMVSHYRSDFVLRAQMFGLKFCLDLAFIGLWLNFPNMYWSIDYFKKKKRRKKENFISKYVTFSVVQLYDWMFQLQSGGTVTNGNNAPLHVTASLCLASTHPELWCDNTLSVSGSVFQQERHYS